MTERTAAQIDADETLSIAITRVISAYGMANDGEMLMDYVIVGYTSSFDLVEREGTRQVMIYRDGNVLSYTGEGLLRAGLRTHIDSMETEGEDDD